MTPVSAELFGGAVELHVGKRRALVTPEQAFDLARELIRVASRAIVIEEADRIAIQRGLDGGPQVDAQVFLIN